LRKSKKKRGKKNRGPCLINREKREAFCPKKKQVLRHIDEGRKKYPLTNKKKTSSEKIRKRHPHQIEKKKKGGEKGGPRRQEKKKAGFRGEKDECR